MNLYTILYSTPDDGKAFLVTCAVRILAALLCGAVIGLERTHRQKGAGIRTHIIVSLGAVCVMLVSKYGFYDLAAAGYDVDPTRIASNIMTGMGFIGAGVIFVKNTSIKGLTTAAGLWATTGVAMAIGTGMYAIGVFVTAVMLLSQILLHVFLRSIDTAGASDLTVSLRATDGAYERFAAQFADSRMIVESCKYKREGAEATIRIVCKVSDEMSVDDVLRTAGENPDIISVEF